MLQQTPEQTTTEEAEEPRPPAHNPLGGSAPFDFLTDALIPLCILGMVASFTYFLVELRAAHVMGGNQILKYVFFWFLIGVVCISRLRAKYGGQVVAAPYTIALGLVMVLFVMRFSQWGGSLTGQGGSLGALLMLGIVGMAWWAIHRLTDECTIEEDREDESEEGLLSSFHRRGDVGATRRRRHPGRLVIVFGLVALGVFALSQPVVERSGQEVAGRAFQYMLAYLVCTLALLALTSLSGLRLYVRKRGAEMDRHLPPAWLVASAVVIATILTLAALAPRAVNSGGQEIARRIAEGFGSSRQDSPVDSPVEGVRAPDGGRVVGRKGEGDREATAGDAAEGTSGGAGQTGSTTGRTGSQASDAGGGQSPGTGEGQGEGPGEQESTTEGDSGEQEHEREAGESGPADGQQDGGATDNGAPSGTGQETADEAEPGESSAPESAESTPSTAEDAPPQRPTGPQSEPTPPTPQSAAPTDLSGLKWIAYALGALVLLYALGRLIPAFGRLLSRLASTRLSVLAPLRAAWGRLRQFLERILPKRTTPAGPEASALPDDPYANPFTDRALLERLPPRLMVEHSYHALLSYAASRGCERRDDQTPLEYLRTLPDKLTEIKDELTVVTRLYIEAAYTPAEVPASVIDTVRPVWDKLEQLVRPQEA